MFDTHQRLFEATSIGNIAFETISNDQEGSVVGITSRGLFCKTSSKWLIFISVEPFRGPLTINLPEPSDSLQQITIGMRIRVSSGQLIIPDANLVIDTQRCPVWQPQFPYAPLLSVTERHKRLTDFATKAMKLNQEDDLSVFLPALLRFPNAHYPPIQDIHALQSGIFHLRQHVIDSGYPPAEIVCNLLGSGPGLTPSGDDIVIGMLLALNRWREVILPGNNLHDLNHQVMDTAYQKTTTLSANLIECATLGLADERLINALDWLVSDIPEGTRYVDKLLEWGSTSGVNVFVGFVIALSS